MCALHTVKKMKPGRRSSRVRVVKTRWVSDDDVAEALKPQASRKLRRLRVEEVEVGQFGIALSRDYSSQPLGTNDIPASRIALEAATFTVATSVARIVHRHKLPSGWPIIDISSTSSQSPSVARGSRCHDQAEYLERNTTNGYSNNKRSTTDELKRTETRQPQNEERKKKALTHVY